MVLGTDMHHHQETLQKLEHFSKIIEYQGYFDLKQFQDTIPRVLHVPNEKFFIMETALHCCDISNPCKKTSVSMQWTTRITQEFFNQGDMEKAQELPVSAGCDRKLHKNYAKQSLGFIDFIVFPLWSTYHTIDPSVEHLVEQIQENRSHWMEEAQVIAELESEHTHTITKTPASGLSSNRMSSSLTLTVSSLPPVSEKTESDASELSASPISSPQKEELSEELQEVRVSHDWTHQK